MSRTIVLLGIVVSAYAPLAGAEEPEFGHETRLFGHPIASPPTAALSSGVWQVGFDHKLDGKVEAGDSPLLVLDVVNGRLTGHYRERRAAGKENRSLFAGSVIAGTPPIVTLRQDDPLGYTAIYSGRLVSSDRVVGSYVDNRGFAGDWSLTLASKQAVEPLTSRLPDKRLLESVLGVYGRAIRGKRAPYVNLRPPSRNLWTPEIQESLDGALSYGDVDYIGQAKLVVTRGGLHTIGMPGAGVQLRLNGQLLEAGDVHLSKGVYDVEIYTNHWGQPYLTYAQVDVHHKDTQKPVPFVNFADDVAAFRASKVAGRPVVEVCQYTAKQINLE